MSNNYIWFNSKFGILTPNLLLNWIVYDNKFIESVSIFYRKFNFKAPRIKNIHSQFILNQNVQIFFSYLCRLNINMNISVSVEK